MRLHSNTLEKEKNMTEAQIEKIFERWYDSRKCVPPAAWESFNAGWMAAIKHLTKGDIK